MSESFLTIRRRDGMPAIEEVVHGGAPESTGGFPPHWHSAWQLVRVVRGDGWVRTRGVEHRTPAGAFFLVPPGEVHSNDTYAEGCDFRSMLVADDAVAAAVAAGGTTANLLGIAREPVQADARIAERYERFHSAFLGDRSELELECRLGELLAAILGRTGKRIDRRESNEPTVAVRRAREILWDESAEQVTLTELAERCGGSPFELSRRFTAAYGLPPRAWQIQARVDKARRLLREGTPIAEAAVEAGFSDQPHLTRCFRRVTGTTPGRYVAAFRKNVQDASVGPR